MIEWTRSADRGTLTKIVGVLRGLWSGYESLSVNRLEALIARKAALVALYDAGRRSLCQVWTWNETRRMWRIVHVGFAADVAPLDAMRANVRFARGLMDSLGVRRTYAVTGYPTGSQRLNAYITFLASQLWEAEIERRPGLRAFVFDRADLSRHSEDELWQGPRSRRREGV